MIFQRSGLPLAMLTGLALVLSGCSSTSQSARLSEPEQLMPVQNSTVASSALPPIGQDGTVQISGGVGTTTATNTYPGTLTPDPALTGQPGTYTPPTDPSLQTTDPMQTASTDGSFVTLDAVGTVPNVPGRDLSGGLTVEKLLGGWTIVGGDAQCRLNLTQTSKAGTARYRASTPGCGLQGLATVSSWQLAGGQVQLFDEAGSMIAVLNLSGNRFIGTLSGGQGISMVG